MPTRGPESISRPETRRSRATERCWGSGATPINSTRSAGFGGRFSPARAIRDRALVASNDGVGTKILIAAELEALRRVGADLVNHCVNDILVVNATPLFFFDYLAVGKLDPAVAAEIVEGCVQACRAHDCALLGGETAEMPGLYAPGHFDLAGTIVGIVAIADLPKPRRPSPRATRSLGCRRSDCTPTATRSRAHDSAR